jgi:hypothetical protein
MLRRVCGCVALVCLIAACGSSSKQTGTSTVGSTTTTLHPVLAATTTLPNEATTTATSSANTSKFNMHAKGSINGVDFDGPIAGSSLQCSPSGDGNYVAVQWGGTIVIKGRGEQISGDMNLKIGGTDFPTGGIASIVLKGDYQTAFPQPPEPRAPAQSRERSTPNTRPTPTTPHCKGRGAAPERSAPLRRVARRPRVVCG